MTTPKFTPVDVAKAHAKLVPHAARLVKHFGAAQAYEIFTAAVRDVVGYIPMESPMCIWMSEPVGDGPVKIEGKYHGRFVVIEGGKK